MNRHWQSTLLARCFLVVWAVSPLIVGSAVNNPQPASDRAKPMSTEAEVREFLETKSKAEAGNVDAQYKLGGMFAKGAGTAKDDATAVLCYRKVAEQNDPRGQSMLGVMSTNATKQQLMKLEAQMTAEQKAAAAEVTKEIETRLARLKKKS